MALFSPYFVAFQIIKETDNRTQCVNGWLFSVDLMPSFHLFVAITVLISFIIPCICIIILYSLMIYKLYSNSKNVANMLNNRHLISRKRENKRITCISLGIIVAFLILWGPFYVTICLFIFLWDWNLPADLSGKVPIIIFTVQYLGYMNSAVNPCIYFFFLKNYRQGLKCLLCKGQLRQRSLSTQNRMHRRSTIISLRSGPREGWGKEGIGRERGRGREGTGEEDRAFYIKTNANSSKRRSRSVQMVSSV
jgi:hypothetical protein